MSDVMRADRERVAAMLSADELALESVLHDGLTYTHADGRVDSKSSLIQALTSGRVDYRGIAAEPTIRLHGSTALIHGPVKIQVVADGMTHRMSTMSTLVYWRERGRWQLAAYQSTLVGAEEGIASADEVEGE